MRFSRVLTSIVIVAVAGAVLPVHSAIAAATCFGKRATIVGTNRDRSKSVDLIGTSGNDVIVSLSGSDTIDGKGGDDLICAGGGDDFIKAGAGNDKIKGGEHGDTTNGGGGHDRMWGESGTDALLGGPGSDRLLGGAGPEDSLIGGPGDDFMDGGADYDLAEFWDSPRGVHADLRSDTATGRGRDTIVSIEGLIGSRFDDVLLGDELSNMLQAGEGNDELRAFGTEGDGGFDFLRSAGGDNILDGGDGPDIATYNLTPWPITADLQAGTTTSDFGTDTLVGIEHLIGSRENDTIFGNDEDNLLVGNWGDDILDGRGGVDEIAFFDATEDTVADLATGTSDAGLRGGTDTFVDFENLSGSIWKDVLTGDGGPNVIWGGNRTDSLAGLDGDDVLLGGAGTDGADGGSGTDECDAEVETNCEVDPMVANTEAGTWTAALINGGAAWSAGISGSARGTEEVACTPARSRIAFVRDLGGNIGTEIFTVRPDGSGLKRLTDNRTDDWGPAWSPDGTKIAFGSHRDGDGEIYVMNRDGTGVTQLTENESPDHLPTWSPDGKSIAFSSARDDPEGINDDLYVMSADGSDVTKILGGFPPEWIWDWSPDGRRILFNRTGSIFSARPDGTDVKKLTRRMDASNPEWSPDGRRILFQAEHPDTTWMDIHVMRGDGSYKRTLISAPGSQQTPSWSPNGRRIAFADRWRVAVAHADGSRSVTLFDHDLADYTVDWGSPVLC